MNKACDKISAHFDSNVFMNRHMLRYYLIRYLLAKDGSFLFYDKDQFKTNELLKDQFGNELMGVDVDLDIQKSKFIIYSIKNIQSIFHTVTILGILLNFGGQIFIEDPTHKIKLIVNPNNTLFGRGVYCYNHIVIVRGKMNHLTEEFHVELMFHPPMQCIDENTTNDFLYGIYLDNNKYISSSRYEINTTNTKDKVSFDKHDLRIKSMEEFKIKAHVSRNHYWVIISDILLTSENVIENLHKVFSGYEKMINETNTRIAFVLLGNFINCDFGSTEESDKEKICIGNDFTKSNTLSEYLHEVQYDNLFTNFDKSREGFERLHYLLEKFPKLMSNSSFFIVSGPNDIGPDLLPKNPLSDYYTSQLSKRFESKIYFFPNPYFIDDGENKIFISRCSLAKELKEKTLFSYYGKKNLGLTNNWNIEPEILESILPPTLLGQQHLTPTSQNIISPLDNRLFLLPTPNLLFICDSSPSYSVKSMNQVWIVNPGSFKNTNSWVQYNVINDSIDHVWL
ncbi:DNA polymerase epsilon subunit [Cryptosporidium canis]|uniref:DNA polymerase II subunit 2 n=1 Tax=Cryptosporidium canis TaxID=195482 RepID=A0A9D5HXF3_9CRYT|nr:DNA polymerase epsilon subunit [Cryptosporidium canis]